MLTFMISMRDLFSSIIFWRKRSSGCLAGLSIRRRLVYSPPTGLLCCGESLQPWSRSTLGPCNLPQCLCRERKRDWQGVPKKTHIQNGGLTWEAVRPQDKNGRTDPRAFWDSYHYDHWGFLTRGRSVAFWQCVFSETPCICDYFAYIVRIITYNVFQDSAESNGGRGYYAGLRKSWFHGVGMPGTFCLQGTS